MVLAFFIMEMKNGLTKGVVKTAKFLTQGLVSYQDSDAGIALLKNETIHDGIPSFAGCPVILDHKNIDEKNYAKERKGNVIGTSYNPTDGWFYVNFVVDDEIAIKKIEEEGYSVSCAYNVLDVAAGGTYQDIPYDGEITKISFTHLALVTMPRYEESRILDEMPGMLINSKIQAHNITKQEGERMFKLFQKKADGKQEEVTPFVLINGKEIKLAELVDSYAKNGKDGDHDNDMNKEKYQAKDEDMVDVNGNSVSIGELKNAYMKASKKNAGPDSEDEGPEEDHGDPKGDTDKAKKEVEKAAEESGEKKKKPVDKQEKDVTDKKNSKEEGNRFFAELENASGRVLDIDDTVASSNHGLTRAERANAWKAKTNKKD